MAEVPEAALLRRALRNVTETLARELAAPSPTAPDWSEVDWRLAIAVAAIHGISPLLSMRLRWSGPPLWRGFLEQQRDHTLRRHRRIEALLLLLDRRARAEDIPALALKGAALHAMGVYVPGDRPMADVDLLIRPSDGGRATTLLESMGLRESAVTRRERVFVPMVSPPLCGLGEHADSAVKVEVHERIFERLPHQVHDLTNLVLPARFNAGLNDYGSAAALLRHLVLHAAGAMVTRALRMLNLHDIRLLSGRLDETDWSEFLCDGADGADGRRLWWAFAPFALTAHYYGSIVPPRVLRVLERACPHWLRHSSLRCRISDVSCSNPRIDAFPAIEWSQSPALALQYFLHRLWPSAAHIAEREAEGRRAGWAAASDWSALSQRRRVARWIASRTSRPVTMHVVRAAFAYASPEVP